MAPDTIWGKEFDRTQNALRAQYERQERLHAAAPDLLAALKAVVDHFGPWHDDDCPGDDTCDCTAKPIHDAVNAAIRKAEGS